MTNEDVHELAAAYALDALAGDERHQFETHLLECEQCRDELVSLRETVGVLAFSTEGPLPSADLRDRILVAAREERPTVVAFRPRRTRLYVGAAGALAACAALAIGLTLALSGGSSGPSLSVAVDQGVAQLAVSGLSAAPAGKDYEVWVIETGKSPSPAGLFKDGEMVVKLSRPVPKGATVAVTLEKAGGTTSPTTPILASTTLSA
jgi:anti-sigma-K factor RskA